MKNKLCVLLCSLFLISSCERNDGLTYYSFVLEDENYGYLCKEDGSLVEGTSYLSCFNNKSGHTEIIQAKPFDGFHFSHWELKKNDVFYKIESLSQVESDTTNEDASAFPSINRLDIEQFFGLADDNAGHNPETPYTFKACFERDEEHSLVLKPGPGVKKIIGPKKYKINDDTKLYGRVEAVERTNNTFVGWYKTESPSDTDLPVSTNKILDLSTLTITENTTLYPICDILDKYFSYEIFCENFIDETDEEKYRDHNKQNKTFLGIFNDDPSNLDCFYEQEIVPPTPPETQPTLNPSDSLILSPSNGYIPSNPNYGEQKTDIYGRHYEFIGWIDDITNAYSQSIISTSTSFSPSIDTYPLGHRFYAYFDLRK